MMTDQVPHDPLAGVDKRQAKDFIAAMLQNGAEPEAATRPAVRAYLGEVGDGADAVVIPSAEDIEAMPAMAFYIEQLPRITPFRRSFLFEEIKAGRLKSRRYGRHRVVLLRDVLAWLQGEEAA